MPRSSQERGSGIPGSRPRPPRPVEPAPLIAIVGPTGTGKSALALDLALALEGELISCDALQVYRRFDIATAKPSTRDRRRVRHHLVDECDPGDEFTLARFVDRAERTIAQLQKRGVQPILVGGTGMYLRGLLRGIVPAPEVDPRLRRRLRDMHARREDSSMHRWLSRVDPTSAARIPPRDRQRVGRALEWWLTSRTRWSERLDSRGTWTGSTERFRCLKLGLDADTRWLRERLDARVDRFFAAGLVDEVRGLLASGVSEGCNAFKAIGYREVARALREGGSVEAAIELVKTRTGQYAKRQRTWFRKEPGIIWLNAAHSRDTLRRAALDTWSRFPQDPV